MVRKEKAGLSFSIGPNESGPVNPRSLYDFLHLVPLCLLFFVQSRARVLLLSNRQIQHGRQYTLCTCPVCTVIRCPSINEKPCVYVYDCMLRQWPWCDGCRFSLVFRRVFRYKNSPKEGNANAYNNQLCV